MRVFICTDNQFPEGNADSNYIRYLALSIQNAGCEVIVVGSGVNRSQDYDGKKYSYRGIEYYNTKKAKDRIPFHLEPTLTCGKEHLQYMGMKGLNSKDYVVMYTSLFRLHKLLFDSNLIPHNHIICTSVEWMQPMLYRFGRFNPSYQLREYVINKYTRLCGKVIAISQKLSERFIKNGCTTLIVPMLTETTEYKKLVSMQNTIKFIYPGAAFKKDKITSIVEAVPLLEEEICKRVEIHFTGMKKEALSNELGDNKWILDKFASVFVFHGWLEYQDLLNLYNEIDCLLLPREENQFTTANFPSKVPELMRYGVIPVCSDVGDYTKLYLEDKIDSLIFCGGQPIDCANAIKRVCNLNPEELLELKERVVKSAEEKFDFRKWSNRIVNFIMSN